MTRHMGLALALKSEAMRLARSPLLVLHGALAGALGGLSGAYFAFSPWDSLLGADAFFQLLGAGAPLLAGIACGLSIDAEREAGGCANLLGVPSRRTALAAKTLALLALGLASALVATALFLGILAGAGREAPGPGSVALAVLGMGAGSGCLYVAMAFLALRFGRNASIGVGALGFAVALASLGGLANGLVTGTFSGTLGMGAALFVPFSWPSRFASLAIEAGIAHAAPGGEAAVGALAGALGQLSLVCALATLAVGCIASACANRLECRPHAGE